MYKFKSCEFHQANELDKFYTDEIVSYKLSSGKSYILNDTK
ncbi:hypothetical protein SAMN05444380_10537 [Thermophagus xiamenensis]|uniref:Uncharacterized protein n=1 Tax=Thermophagus xiamenensis TaxID=385682 RepID=A0A1I1WUQ2_9BACT|nr:hypothetical protein SAMN05444380_10537 [Thermophagus xiamenensis]